MYIKYIKVVWWYGEAPVSDFATKFMYDKVYFTLL